MKKTKLLFLSLIVIITVQTHAQNFEWAKAFGGNSSNSNYGRDSGRNTAIDENGNIYTVGSLADSVDFDPESSNASNLEGGGGFITKFTANGNFVWAKKINDSRLTAIKLDASNNLYITGGFSGAVDFDPSEEAVFDLISTGERDAFILKLDAEGSFIWVKKMGGISDDYATEIEIDGTGNILTIGDFGLFNGNINSFSSSDFNPGDGVFNLSGGGLFVLKLDNNGDFVFAKKLNLINSFHQSMKLDLLGNIYIAGFFDGPTDFDPNAGSFELNTTGGTSTFVLKLNNNGSFVWVKSFNNSDIGNNSSHSSYPQSINLDLSGNVYVSGFFEGTVDFNPSNSGVFNISSDSHSTTSTSDDNFIVKLNASGDFLWAKSISSGNTNSLKGLSSVDLVGNVYMTGYFSGTVDFDPSTSGVFNLSSSQGHSGFIVKLDPMGNFLWAKAIVGISNDSFLDTSKINVDLKGNLFITGNFIGTLDFDPSSDTYNLSSSGAGSIFLLKLSAPKPTLLRLCGGTLNTIGQKIIFDNMPDAQEYTFSITDPETNEEHIIVTADRFFRMIEVPNYGFNKTYEVKAKVKIDGVYGEYSDVCEVNTPERLGRLNNAFCNQTLSRLNENLRSINVLGATSYKFKLELGGMEQELESANGRVLLLDFIDIQPNTTYNVSVSVKVNDNWLPFGEVCTITTPVLPTTELVSASCNATATSLYRNFNARVISFAEAYRFKTTINSEEQVVEKPTRTCNMSEFEGATMNQTYSIQVAFEFNGVWSDYGDACNWTVGTVEESGVFRQDVSNNDEVKFNIKAYPNPFSNQITLILSNENIESNIAVYDMTGKMIQTIKTSENEVQVGENLASGVYIVNITQGQETKNIRVVKQ